MFVNLTSSVARAFSANEKPKRRDQWWSSFAMSSRIDLTTNEGGIKKATSLRCNLFYNFLSTLNDRVCYVVDLFACYFSLILIPPAFSVLHIWIMIQ